MVVLAAALIYVVDSHDRQQLAAAFSELSKLLQEKELKDASLLIFASKQVRVRHSPVLANHVQACLVETMLIARICCIIRIAFTAADLCVTRTWSRARASKTSHRSSISSNSAVTAAGTSRRVTRARGRGWRTVWSGSHTS